MRKTIYTLMIAATVFTACSKSDSNSPTDPALKLTTSNAELKYDATTQLNVNNGKNTDYTWSSSDEFVGTVESDGKFTAKHIGKTTIKVEKSGKSASQDITVTPTESLFDEPVIEFGASKAEIKAKEKRELLLDVDGGLAFKDPSSAVRMGILYLFDANDKLMSALIPITETTIFAKRASVFYAERYQIVGTEGTEFFFTEESKKYALILDSNNLSYGFSAMYIEYPDIEASTDNMKKQLMTIQKRLKNFNINF